MLTNVIMYVNVLKYVCFLKIFSVFLASFKFIYFLCSAKNQYVCIPLSGRLLLMADAKGIFFVLFLNSKVRYLAVIFS